MTMRTFAGNAPYPRRREHWDDIARLSAELRDDRHQRDPKHVASGAFDQAEAERRLRVMGAIAAMWAKVIDRLDLPTPDSWRGDFGATLEEMRAEAEAVAAGAERQAKAAPGDRDRVQRAELSEALRWHFQPIAPGSLPHIWLAHDFAQWELRRNRGQRAA